MVVDGHEVLGSQHPQRGRGRAEHPAGAGQRVGQLAVTQMGELLGARRLADLGTFGSGDRMWSHLGDRQDIGEITLGQCEWIASPDPAAHPAGIDHQDFATAGDRHVAGPSVGDGPDDERFDLRRQTHPADGPGQTPPVFPRNRVFSIASS